MTALLETSVPQTPAPALGQVTFPRVVNSEWIKLRTLRSTWVTLAAAALAMVGIGVIFALASIPAADVGPDDRGPSAVLIGYFLAQLAVGVLGVLVVSGEYATGMIRATLTAVPKRVPVLAAKAAVFSAVVFTTMALASLVAVAVSQPLLPDYRSFALLDGEVLRSVLATALYLTLVGLLGGALGWVLRSTPGGISALLGLLLVAPVVFQLLPGTWSDDVRHLLPGEAGASFVSSVPIDGALGAGAGLAVFVAWVVGAYAVATALLRRRDG